MRILAETAEHLGSWWGPALAFVAGVVSFASPCVLPLVPGYLSFVTGESLIGGSPAAGPTSVEGSTVAVAPARRVRPILLFILGFTIVFTAMGALVTRINVASLVRGTTGRWIAGGFVVAVGLLMIGYALRLGPLSLYAERRPFLERVKPSGWSGLPLGMAFAAGWTPCIGTVLAGILALAAGATVWRGVVLLIAYSFGLGLPFLLIGLGVQRLMGFMGWAKRHYSAILACSGTLLVALGMMIATGTFARWIAPLQRYLPGFGL
jgi:cytochrome c-type biogenesis protein